MNKIVLAQLVSIAFAVLAFFHIVLPSTMTEPTVIAAALLLAAVATSILRVLHGDPLADAKSWYQSRILWLQIIGAAYALLALIGVSPAIDQGSVVAAVMGVIGLLTTIFGAKPQRPIG